ncbi:hypothetical protein LTR70_008927 [Exophiala xenobiotica]|uniref:Uncharacterized protein n=1 Tax=Lithohypha guttulata TaxID=1690604 RepID=A0ABR0JZB6_9EURO|nr:hypothetical protein LTR24_008655 [Lithohypha guttulata]KAK5311211.1 hypothetical protein LTR70_008927 [Exophiala xenobiotica]
MAQGNGLEIRKHISGLVHLVIVRGGLHYLGLGGLVSDMLTYADVMQAIFFNTEPVWAVPLPPLDISPSAKMGSGFRGLSSASQGIDPPLVLAAQSVCKVAAIFQCTGTLDECVCLALILLHHVVLRNDGTITPAILQVEYQFWQALEQAEEKGVMAAVAPRLYVWMCCMGATVSVLLANGGRTRFSCVAVEKLRRVQAKAGVVGWESVRTDVLEEFCWVGVVQEEMFRRMWTEVEHLNTTGIHGDGVAQLPATNQNLLPPAG